MASHIKLEVSNNCSNRERYLTTYSNVPRPLTLNISSYIPGHKEFVAMSQVNHHWHTILAVTPEKIMYRFPDAAVGFAIKSIQAPLTNVCSFPRPDYVQNAPVQPAADRFWSNQNLFVHQHDVLHTMWGFSHCLTNKGIKIVKHDGDNVIGCVPGTGKIMRNLCIGEKPENQIIVHDLCSGKPVKVLQPMKTKTIENREIQVPQEGTEAVHKVFPYGENHVALVWSTGLIQLASLAKEGASTDIVKMKAGTRVIRVFCIENTIVLQTYCGQERRIEAFSNLHNYNPDTDHWVIKVSAQLMSCEIACTNQNLFIWDSNALTCYRMTKEDNVVWRNEFFGKLFRDRIEHEFSFSENGETMLLVYTDRQIRAQWQFVVDIRTGKHSPLGRPGASFKPITNFTFWNNHCLTTYGSWVEGNGEHVGFAVWSSKSNFWEPRKILINFSPLHPIKKIHALPGISGLLIGREIHPNVNSWSNSYLYCTSIFTCVRPKPVQNFALLKAD